MNFKDLEKMILKKGWYLKDIRGSHHNYIHDEIQGKITIPNHKGDLNIKTVNSILKQAGLK